MTGMTDIKPIYSIKDVGRIVKRYRTANSVQQQELADSASISRKLLSEIERGVNKDYQLNSIMRLLSVTSATLCVAEGKYSEESHYLNTEFHEKREDGGAFEVVFNTSSIQAHNQPRISRFIFFYQIVDGCPVYDLIDSIENYKVFHSKDEKAFILNEIPSIDKEEINLFLNSICEYQ